MRECPECKRQLSSSAKKCPGCGHQFTQWTTIVIGCVIVLAMVCFLLSAFIMS